MKSETVTVAELSEVLGVTPHQIQKLATAQVLPKLAHGQYDLIQTVQAYIRFLKERSGGREYLDSRSQLTKAKAEIMHMERARLAGTLIDIKAVEQSRAAAYAVVRTRLLAIPAKSAARVKMAPTVTEVASILREEVCDALSELANADVKIIDSPAGGLADDGFDADETDLVGAGATSRSDDLAMG